MTRILIDLQACQNESRFRGLGRYVKNMAREIAKIAAPGSVHLLLNSRFGHTILPLRQYFSDFVPDANIHVVELLDQADDRSERGRWRNDASALMREAYIEMLAPDVVFMPSFFEGFIDDVVLSVHRLSRVPVVATVGAFTWDSSMFPRKDRGCYDLPLNAKVRQRLQLGEGQRLDVTIDIDLMLHF